VLDRNVEHRAGQRDDAGAMIRSAPSIFSYWLSVSMQATYAL
jgi:hypothetical protein